MKLTLASVSLLVLALEPAANAQVSCGEIRRLIAEAEDDFRNIQGAKVDGDVREATYLIGGARECYVEVGIAAAYYCIFQHDRPDTAFSAYRYRLSEMRSCLSSWKQNDLREEPPLKGDGYRDLEGVSFSGSGDYDDLTWLVGVEQHIQDGHAHYHVRIELEYF